MNPGIKIVLIVATLTTVIACSKGGTITDDGSDGGGNVNNPSDTTAPVLTINNPLPNQVYTNWATINVSGNISDDLGLYRGSIRITNDAGGGLLKEQLYEIHGIRTYNFSVNHTATVTAASDYTVTVSFEDHGYNSTTKTVKIKVNP